MDYREFIEMVKEDLPERLFGPLQGAAVEDIVAEKLQGQSYEGIRIIPEDSIVSIMMDLQPFFQMINHGNLYEEVLDAIAERADLACKEYPDVSIDMLKDYEKMRENLTVKLVGHEGNEQMLQKIPHYDMEDLSLVYQFKFPGDEGMTASILITSDMVKKFGITEEQLHQDALRQAVQQSPLILQTMEEVIREITGGMVDAKEMVPTYVASNKSRTNGASVLMYPDFFKEAADLLKESFFILPSSIHDLILVPAGEDNLENVRELQQMVREVNATKVRPEERLSNYVYHYDISEKIFERVDKYMERKREQFQNREKGADSVLSALHNHQKECMERPKKEIVSHHRDEAVL